jgi:CheY-like chemotaxis protein
MPETSATIWWIELIKISPGLITVLFCIVLVVLNRKTLVALLERMTKFKGLGVEAEFATKELDSAIASQEVKVSADDRKGALKRLNLAVPLLRNARLLWVDDEPASTRSERALLEKAGAHVTAVKTSAEAERELIENEYLLVITDLKREGNPTEGLDFVGRTVASGTYRWTIAYVGTAQWGKPRPEYLFAITNRPDHLIHYICDVAERERL